MRRNGTDLQMQTFKTESAKRGLYYRGMKIFNALSLHLKTEKHCIHFKEVLKVHFTD